MKRFKSCIIKETLNRFYFDLKNKPQAFYTFSCLLNQHTNAFIRATIVTVNSK